MRATGRTRSAITRTPMKAVVLGGRRLEHLAARVVAHRRALVVAVHVVIVSAAYLLAHLLRFEYRIPDEQWSLFFRTLPLLIMIRMAVFGWFHLNEGLWRYVSVRDLAAIFAAVSISSLLFSAGIFAVYGHGFPRSVVFIDWVLCFGMVAGVRLAIRAARESISSLRHFEGRRTLIAGAGDAGERLIREIEQNPNLDFNVIGLVDDHPRKRGSRIHGIEVVGSTDELPQLCRERDVENVLLALPSATAEQRGRIVETCRESGVVIKSVPSIYDLFSGRAGIGQLEEITPEDLLGRQAVRVDRQRLLDEIRGRRVMVTGAAGSIGSELCRQLATLDPAALILYERAESNLYFVELELEDLHPDLPIASVVGDICDRGKLDEAMTAHEPEILYHAAAYKHVPLMEQHPLEAIDNNVFGTEAVALAAERHGVRKLVLISTDKAVRPVSVMGMTKRVAEDLLLARDGGPTTYVSVRFGNVLGSAGSVVPLFQWQIAKGGPVTVTHPDATRYFMLIMEAAQLVLQAGTMGRGGEVFFLDMGEPVRIIDLAENLIRLAGFDPARDLTVRTVGLRPGERLSEELVGTTEKFLVSEHEKIYVVEDPDFDRSRFRAALEELRVHVQARDLDAAVMSLSEMAMRSTFEVRPGA